MTIHIRQFSVDAPETMQAIRTIGGTKVVDAQGNRLCVYGNADTYTPCFDNKVPSGYSPEPLSISQIASFPLYYPQMAQDGANGRPPTACPDCKPENQSNCLGYIGDTASCIFSVCQSRFIRPQFVFLGKNWSFGIVDNGRSSWGNGHNVQAQWLRGTIFEGGYFTDFIKGKTLTDFPEMERWLLEVDPLLGYKKRFFVFIEILAKELELLRTKFNLDGADKYVIIWGPGILRTLNRVTNKIYGSSKNFADLDCLAGYKIRLFGTHYTPRGSVLRSLPQELDRELLTIRRIYKTAEERTADCRDDHKQFDFEIMPEQRVLLPDGNEEQIVWLA